VAEVAATSAGKTKADATARDEAPSVKRDVSKGQVRVGDIIHLSCNKSKGDNNNHDAEVITCLTSLVKVKFLQGPCTSTDNTFTYDNIATIVKSAGPTASIAAAATGAAAVASPLAAAFSASAGVAGAGSKDKHVDIEKELEAVLEGKRSRRSFSRVRHHRIVSSIVRMWRRVIALGVGKCVKGQRRCSIVRGHGRRRFRRGARRR
jgi:hypothetical protein